MLSKEEKMRKRELKNMGETYQFFADQIEGLIRNTVEECTTDCEEPLTVKFDRYGNGGMDVYIFDSDYCSVDKFNMTEFSDPNVDDILRLVHLHANDLFYFLANFWHYATSIDEKIEQYYAWKKRNK